MRKKGRGSITKISDLFSVYTTRFKAPQGTVIKTLQEVVFDVCEITLKKEQCSYTVSSKTLFITAAGPLKTEISIHKKEILQHLKGRLGEKSAPTEIL